MIVNDLNKGIFYLVISVGLLGVFAGLAISGADIVNPWTSQAIAAQTELQTGYEAELNQIDLNYYQIEREQQAQTQISKAHNDVIYHEELNQVKVKLFDLVGKIAIGLIAYIAVLAAFLFFWHRFHQIQKHKDSLAQQPTQLTQAYLRPKPSQNGTNSVQTNELYPVHDPISHV